MTAGVVENHLPGLQMVAASCASVGGGGRERDKGFFSPIRLLKVSWYFGIKMQVLWPCLTSLHLYRLISKHSHSGDKDFRLWMPGETTECIAWKLALWSQTAWAGSNLGQAICSLCFSVFCTLKVKIVFVAFLCWINKLSHALISRLVYGIY